MGVSGTCVFGVLLALSPFILSFADPAEAFRIPEKKEAVKKDDDFHWHPAHQNLLRAPIPIWGFLPKEPSPGPVKVKKAVHQDASEFEEEPWLNVEPKRNIVVSSRKMDEVKRANHQYDVPQIECPPADDGMERFACPKPDEFGRYRCVDDHVLCDGFIDCPQGEDEDRQACMFYKTTKSHLDVLADALLRWARGKK